MPLHLAILIAATATTTSRSKSSGGSSATSLIFLVVIVAAAYFLFIRPRQARARQAQTRGRQLAAGDEVVTVGGILGHIVDLDDQAVRVEVSPGVVMSFLRRAVSPRPDAQAAVTGGAAVADAAGREPGATDRWDAGDGADHDAEQPGPDGGLQRWPNPEEGTQGGGSWPENEPQGNQGPGTSGGRFEGGPGPDMPGDRSGGGPGPDAPDDQPPHRTAEGPSEDR